MYTYLLAKEMVKAYSRKPDAELTRGGVSSAILMTRMPIQSLENTDVEQQGNSFSTVEFRETETEPAMVTISQAFNCMQMLTTLHLKNLHQYGPAIALPTRIFHALYVWIFSLYFAVNIQDLSIFYPIYLAAFSTTLLEITAGLLYTGYHHWNHMPYQATNANWLLEFLEKGAAFLTLISLWISTAQDGVVSAETWRGLLLGAVVVAGVEMITGVEDLPYGTATAHTMSELLSKPAKHIKEIALYTRICLGLLRLTRTHMLTLLYSIADSLYYDLPDIQFFDSMQHAVYVAVFFALLYGITTRVLTYGMWQPVQASWVPKVAYLDGNLYALNHAAFALDALTYFISTDMVAFEHIANGNSLFKKPGSAIAIFLPALIVAIAVFRVAKENYKNNVSRLVALKNLTNGEFDQDSAMETALSLINTDNNAASPDSFVESLSKISTQNFFHQFTGYLVSSNQKKIDHVL